MGCCVERQSPSARVAQAGVDWDILEQSLEVEVDRIFTELDITKNQILCRKDLEAAQKHVQELGYHISVNIKDLDQNGNGQVDAVEFEQALFKQMRERKGILHEFVVHSAEFREKACARTFTDARACACEKARSAFRAADENGDGKVDAWELFQLVQAMSESSGAACPSQSKVSSMLRRHTDSGVLNEKQFGILLEDLLKDQIRPDSHTIDKRSSRSKTDELKLKESN